MEGTLFSPAGCLMLSGALFLIGAFGVIARRNLVIVLMSIEIMLGAGALALVAFARMRGGIDGQVMVLFTIAASTAQAGVGLAILMALFRQRGSVDVDLVDEMRG